ncbi:hypothetical protein [Mycobacterium sp.]|uniref:hypothetical protein n=1 Tax=Mycobacterium sp. TaxID=1785 RepID=UPI003D6A24F5
MTTKIRPSSEDRLLRVELSRYLAELSRPQYRALAAHEQVSLIPHDPFHILASLIVHGRSLLGESVELCGTQ